VKINELRVAIKKLLPPKKEKIDFSSFWFVIKVIFVM